MADYTRHVGNLELRLKDQDNCDRFDSGIDSYNSFQSYDSSRSTSLQNPPTLDSISTQITSMTISQTTTSPNIDNPHVHDLQFKKSELVEEDRIDSGLESIGYASMKSESIEQEPEPGPLAKWFIPDTDGDTYLQLAIIKKHEAVFDIIQMCSVPELLDVANSEQQTALHLAVLTDQPKLTRCLVAYGANVRCKDKLGNTPLHIACERGLTAHIHMLTSKLDKEEDPGLQSFDLPQNVNERNYLGFTPLHLAVCNNRVQAVRYLIVDLKCDVNVADLKSGRTALHHAIERRSSDVVLMILAAHADVNALTYDECSPLHLAAARGLRAEANNLLKYGADLFLITRDDQDVFELSAHNSRLHKMLRDVERRYREGRRSHQTVVKG